jgi:hypothetical protein
MSVIELLAASRASKAKALAAASQPRLQPVATGSHFPFQPSTNLTAAGNQMAFRSMHWFPKGATSIRLLYPSVYAGAQETATTTGFPLKVAAAVSPPPWDATKAYQVGETVIGYATQYNGAGVFAPSPYYVAVSPNTNSRPTPVNPNWALVTDFPNRRNPVTVDGLWDATFPTVTLVGGTVVAKGLILTDPIPFTARPASWAEIVSSLPCSGSQTAVLEGQAQNMALAPLVATGASVPDATTANLGTVAMQPGSVGSLHMRPAAIIGIPLTAVPSVVIVGDSIPEGKTGFNMVGGATIVSGGANYKVGDILTPSLNGMTAGAMAAGSSPKLIVNRVDGGGAILNIAAIDGGAFTNTATQTGQTLPNGTQTLSGGSGTGATATLTFITNCYDSGDLLGAQGYVERELAAQGIPYIPCSASGDRANLWAGNRMMTRLALIAKSGAKNAFLLLGRNDLSVGDSLATIQANQIAVAAAILGQGVERVFIGTVTPEGTSTTAAGPSSLADQNVTANNSIRLALNAWKRAGAPMINGVAVAVGTPGALLAGQPGHPFYGVIDVAATVEDGGASAPTGKCIVIGGLPSSADVKHFGPSAIALMQAAVRPAIPLLAS